MKKTTKFRMFAGYGVVAAVTAVSATVLAGSEPEVKAVETSVDWKAAPDWSWVDTAVFPAEATTPAAATEPATVRPAGQRI